MDIYGLISLHVWIAKVVADIWWKFNYNSPIRNILTEKSVSVQYLFYLLYIYFNLYKNQIVKMAICGFTGAYVWDNFLARSHNFLVSGHHHDAHKQPGETLENQCAQISPTQGTP